MQPSVNVLTESVIPWFTDFTLLFMLISAFSMCCGYYERVKSGAITPKTFYTKRYHRTWPFFAMMVIISFMMEPSWSTFCQSFADLTMCFNLLPNPRIEIIGVGWFLGTVFTFYMLFPFFTYLLDTKKKGWMVLALSLLFCYIATTYFSTPDMVVKKIDRVNIIYSAPFFLMGGMVYLYRHRLQEWVRRHWWVMLTVCVALTVLRFCVKMGSLAILPDLIVFTAWLVYALGSRDMVLNNGVARYLSGISMEIYLCHMMFCRIASMLHIERLVQQRDAVYVLTVATTLVGAVCFSHLVKYYVFPVLEKKIETFKS